eukprot:6892532-Prymnesium_polylepis.1
MPRDEVAQMHHQQRDERGIRWQRLQLTQVARLLPAHEVAEWGEGSDGLGLPALLELAGGIHSRVSQPAHDSCEPVAALRHDRARDCVCHTVEPIDHGCGRPLRRIALVPLPHKRAQGPVRDTLVQPLVGQHQVVRHRGGPSGEPMPRLCAEG